MIVREVEVAILPPDNLLISPCDVTPSGETVRSLANAKVEDTFCIRKHKDTLNQLQLWKQDKIKLYNNKEK